MMPEDNRGDGASRSRSGRGAESRGAGTGRPGGREAAGSRCRRIASRWWSTPCPWLGRLRRPFRWFWGRAGERLRRQPRQDRRQCRGVPCGLPGCRDWLPRRRRRQRKPWCRGQFFRHRLPWRRHRLQQTWLERLVSRRPPGLGPQQLVPCRRQLFSRAGPSPASGRDAEAAGSRSACRGRLAGSSRRSQAPIVPAGRWSRVFQWWVGPARAPTRRPGRVEAGWSWQPPGGRTRKTVLTPARCRARSAGRPRPVVTSGRRLLGRPARNDLAAHGASSPVGAAQSPATRGRHVRTRVADRPRGRATLACHRFEGVRAVPASHSGEEGACRNLPAGAARQRSAVSSAAIRSRVGRRSGSSSPPTGGRSTRSG